MVGHALTHIGTTVHAATHSLLSVGLHDLVLAVQHLISAVL